MYLDEDEKINKYIEEKFIESDISVEFDSDDEKNKRKKGGMFSKLTSKIKNLTGNQ